MPSQLSSRPTFESLLRQIVREEIRAALAEWVAPSSPRPKSRTVTPDAQVASGQVVLTPDEVAAKLSLVTVQTLYNWRSLSKNGAQIGPRSFKLGRLVRYYESDVDAWLEGLRSS